MTTTKPKKLPLTMKQLDILEYLRKQPQPFSSGRLWSWGVPSQTVTALIRRGFVRPVIGGWTTKERDRAEPGS